MTTKRARLLPANSSQSLEDCSMGPLPPLTSVLVVCRYGPDVLRLPHIAVKVNGYLDGSKKWTIVRACNANLLTLTQRTIFRDLMEPGDSCKRYPEYRQWEFQTGMTKAVERGNLEMVELLSTHFTACIVPLSVLTSAAKLGSLEILQWLYFHRGGLWWDESVVLAAIKGGHVELAKWLYSRTKKVSTLNSRRLESLTGQSGNIEILKWICSVVENVSPWHMLQDAVDSGHLEMVKWIAEQSGSESLCPERSKISLDRALVLENMDTISWMLSNHPDKCIIRSQSVLDDLADHGQLELLQMLHDKLGTHSKYVTHAAASRGYLEIVKRWHAKYPDDSTRDSIQGAAANGFLDTVKWLLENTTTSDTWTTSAMIVAAEHNHLDVVKWLHEKRKEGCTTDAMNLAASNGHLDVVKWLHFHHEEGCTTRAMDRAANSGYLEVVKWLHCNRTEGCTTDAMDTASANGHFNVVKWLHENRSEGCTTLAMDRAAGQGHLEVVKWLHANRREGCTTGAMDRAASNGHLEMAQWLACNRREGCTTNAITAAVRHGHFDVALFLHRACGNCHVVGALYECELALRRFEFADWMYVEGN